SARAWHVALRRLSASGIRGARSLEGLSHQRTVRIVALSNRDRVGRALDLLRDGLAPFVEREFTNVYGDRAREEARRFVQDDRLNLDLPFPEWDVAPLLRLMWEAWNDVFRKT